MNRREFIRGVAAVAVPLVVPAVLAAPAFEDIRDEAVYRFEGGELADFVPHAYHVTGFSLRSLLCPVIAHGKSGTGQGLGWFYHGLTHRGGLIVEVELGADLKPENDTVVRKIEVTPAWVEAFWLHHKDDSDVQMLEDGICVADRTVVNPPDALRCR